MALELRPCCENCGCALAPASTEAMICSFECTFCRSCVESVLANVCPNCGGGFAPRPIRPATDWRGCNSLSYHPASTNIRRRSVDRAAYAHFAAFLGNVPPERR